MLAIGLTGGIGAGKSTVSALLARRGAIVVDADEIARRALDPGTDALVAVAARFGEALLGSDGALDREALAAVVFADPVALHDLEAIVHPVVEAELRAALTEHAGSDAIVILDVALLAERAGRVRYGLDGVIVVDADEATCIERLARGRDMDEEDARRRIAAQMDRFERLRAGDFVILNVGSKAELEEMTDGAWSWIGQLRSELGR